MRISSLRLSVFAALLLLISPAVHAQGFGDLFPNFSFQYGDGGLPAGIDSSVSQLTSPDGQSVKLSGECGPITGDQYAPGFGLSWSGPYDGQMNPGDTFTADLDLSVSVTGGDLQWNFYGLLRPLEGSDYISILTDPAPLTGGQLTGIHLESSAFTDPADGGIFEGYLYIGWSNYSPSDTLTVTIPSDSIDVAYVPVPEPAIACLLPLLLLVVGRRTKRESFRS